MDATLFIETLEYAGFPPRSYSGRGMYGRRCVAVDTGPDGGDIGASDLAWLGAALIRAALEMPDGAGLADDIMDDIRGGSRVDSMGRGIVVYWPAVEWPDDMPDPWTDGEDW